MQQTERLYRIDQLLHAHGVMTRQQLLDALEISWATLKRDLACLKERFNAPIVFDREAGGYRFDKPLPGPAYALPGLWFSADETCALMSMHQLLSELEPGLLTPHVRPLLSRLETIIGQNERPFAEVAERIRLIRTGQRQSPHRFFSVVSQALLERRRIDVRHYARGRDERSDRQLSPQRLVYYRNNWYLEAWCHTREALRRFAVDAFEAVTARPEPAIDVPRGDLEATFSAGYGIYGGSRVDTAVLRFSEAASRWVALEEWHPEQVGRLAEDGRYELRLPYAEPRELVMDILRLGRDVEVIAPASLRQQVRAEIAAMQARYDDAQA